MITVTSDSTGLIFRFPLSAELLQAVPPRVRHFDAHCSAVVSRAPAAELPGEHGGSAWLAPCILDWASQTITVHLEQAINPGITGPQDLDPDWTEALQAVFLGLMLAC